MNIETKKQNYELYERCSFGNKLRTWDSLEQLLKTEKAPPFLTIRYKGGVGGMFCMYNVKSSLLKESIDELINKGADIKLLAFNESAPDEKLLIQGELTLLPGGYQLFFSTEKGKMRHCLKNSGKSESGIIAKEMLRNLMTPSSFSDVMTLIEQYPDHVIEFSTYRMNLGCYPGRNTIIWEVRKY